MFIRVEDAQASKHVLDRDGAAFKGNPAEQWIKFQISFEVFRLEDGE